MDTEKVKQLADNVNKLLALNEEREENIKDLIRLTLRFLPGSKTYNTGYTAAHRKQLIQALESYVDGDNHVKD